MFNHSNILFHQMCASRGFKFAVIACFLSVVSCTSTSRNANTEQSASETLANESGLEYELGRLDGQTLAPGDCGLFLFASKPEPRFVFFAEASLGVGKVVLNGEEKSFIRGQSEGDIIDLHYTDQEYIAIDESFTIKVTINSAEPTEGGANIRSASLAINSKDGWRMVIPVGGATSCPARST